MSNTSTTEWHPKARQLLLIWFLTCVVPWVFMGGYIFALDQVMKSQPRFTPVELGLRTLAVVSVWSICYVVALLVGYCAGRLRTRR